MNWYTLRVISGKEKKIKETILFELNNSNLNESVENILVPTENVLEMRDGKKKVKEKVFFPGYLLIHLEMNKETKYVIENVNGVISFVCNSGWLEKNFADGMRATLEEEFTKIQILNLRGDIRKNMLSKGLAKEGENIFGQGSMTGVCIVLFVKKIDNIWT